MLTVRDVSVGYDGVDVVHRLSFTLAAGERLALIGPNGCGKTTLLRAIAGVLPYRGGISVGQRPLDQMKQRELAREIAMLSQVSAVHFAYSVYDTVMMGRYAHAGGGLLGLPTEEDRAKVLHCLETVDLLDFKDRLVTELSGGQLQRVFLARTLAQDPHIILLDEPTNHLDLRYQIELMEYLKTWVTEGERALIGVLHDVNLGMHFCDKVLVMSEGHARAFGKTEKVLTGSLLRETYGPAVVAYMQQSLALWERMDSDDSAL